MIDTAPAPTSVTITVRPLPAEKQRFTSLARHRGLSEAQLALEAVRFFLKLQAPQSELAAAAPPIRVPATARLTIRLRPGDRRAIAERARLRSMADSAYVAALVRAHVGAKPTLASDEIAALRRAVAVLTRMERHLAELATATRYSGKVPDWIHEELGRVRAELDRLEQLFHDFARAAVRSWEGSP